MKLLRKLTLVLLTGLAFISCQKEYSEENGNGGGAEGSLKSATTGECLPASVQGIYMAGQALTANNFINVTVDFSALGAYSITTNVVNGYSFSAAGVATALGEQTIKLNAVTTGIPATAGSNTFTVSFDSTECNIVVDVLPAGTGAATYTLAGAGGTCTGAVVAGTYTVGTAVTAANTVALSVNVTAVGTYTLSVPASNGVTFSGSGAFTTTGVQTVTLAAGGTPAVAGSFNSSATVGAGTCTFSVTAVAGSTAAIYALAGGPGNCTGFALNGTYVAGVAMTAANTVTAQVTVATPGTYTMTTGAVNGVTFSASGTFTAAGPQPVTLTATGTPVTGGATPVNYTIAGANGTSCAFSVTYTAAPSGAVYTLTNTAGNCSPATPAGTYTAGTTLTAANTVTIQVNVTTIGGYSITTNTVNGYSFSAAGTFTTTGAQSVVLTGTGQPVAALTNVFTTTAPTSTCSFSITVMGSTPTNFLQCSFDGGPIQTFNVDLEAISDATTVGFPVVDVFGYASSTSDVPYLELLVGRMTGGAVNADTYTANQSAQGKVALIDYYDAASDNYYTVTDIAGGTPQTPGISITITSISATRVSGTFFGTIKLDGDGAPKTITNGSFSVAF